MKSPTGWILITLFLIAAIIGLFLLYGDLGIIPGIVLAILFFVGLDRMHRWRSKRLVRSMAPDETLIASGIVSESTFDETPAILVRGLDNGYRVHVADARESQAVRSVSSALTRHANAKDLKQYLVLTTEKGLVHFAPRKSLLAAAQPAYAQEILAGMLTDGIPPTE